MEPNVSLLERAFQMARSGQVATITEITHNLRKEGYVNAPSVMSGKGLRTTLRKLIQANRTEAS